MVWLFLKIKVKKKGEASSNCEGDDRIEERRPRLFSKTNLKKEVEVEVGFAGE